MLVVADFTFNPFQENTYVLYDDTKECIIIDPGCYTQQERDKLADFIKEKDLTPVRLLNTHCHLDHVFGNKFVAEKYNLSLEIHKGELNILESVPQISIMYGIPDVQASPAPGHFIEEGDLIKFGNTTLQTLFTPGHSPASISFYAEQSRLIIAGDVLFQGSIGRTDLPGGDFNTLINNIKNKLFPLGDDVIVYSGHGPRTTIGFERQHNPWLTN